MNDAPILSICIPTYNRCSELEYLLNNIIQQLNVSNLWDKVEICISDNASTDNTGGMVAVFQQQYKNISYFCNEKNLGPDRNYLQCVTLASGKYFVLFGSDDKFEANAIEIIIQNLQRYDNISGMSVTVQGYSKDFSHKLATSAYRPQKDYFASTANAIYIPLGAGLGYLSAQIINRNKWNEILTQYNVSDYCNGYVHVYILAQIIKHAPKWVRLSQILVGWRSGNDSFLAVGTDGAIKRLRIDYGYLKIAKDVFGTCSWIYFRHANQICGIYVFGYLQYIKMNYKQGIGTLWWEVTEKFWMCPNYYLKLLPVFLLPKSGINFIHRLKHTFRYIFQVI